jgi:tetratricopeptide (TPR) repeat protein
MGHSSSKDVAASYFGLGKSSVAVASPLLLPALSRLPERDHFNNQRQSPEQPQIFLSHRHTFNNDTMNAQAVLQEQARAAYKRKDYTKALELFNRAIGRSPSVQLHDNRAACHERLDDLQAALKDAKKSIQLAKEDPTGYVRAGRILVKMERKSVALEIYAMGLKNVKHVGQGFEVSWFITYYAYYSSNLSISSSKRSILSS